MEYLCKLKGRAHIHASWLTADELRADGRLSHQRLVNYEKKKALGELDRFNEQWLQVERVLAVESSAAAGGEVGGASGSGSSGDGDGADTDGYPNRRYFVKWLGLTYDQCTWEIEDDVPQQHIDEYHQREAAFAKRYSKGASSSKSVQPAPSPGRAGDLPAGVLAGDRTMRNYQLDGLKWLRHNYGLGRSVILGDEMGLGKTAQAVAMLQCVRSLHGAVGPMLVVVPLSTMPHWVRELREWTYLDTIVFYGNKNARDIIVKNEWGIPQTTDGARRWSNPPSLGPM